MDKEQIIKRLSIVKFLYKIGMEQSRHSETTSFFSILSFHDSIDMYLNLAAEKIGIEKKKNEKIYFMDYWDKIPTLTLKESMFKLNERRINLKHKGLIPGRIEIETARVNSTDFFEQNTPTLFGITFNEISLCELVKFEKTKGYVKSAQENLDRHQTEECIKQVTMAFHELLYEYKENKRGYGSGYKTQFNFGERIHFSRTDYNNATERKLEDAISKINKNFEYFNNALEVISLGIDYKKYAKFQILTPVAHRMYEGEYHLEIYGTKNWSEENCQFLIDFVLECSFKLQEFDFDYDSLDLTKTEVIIK
jgi:hypothetical protein